jgi:hypothetical protein
MDKMDPGKDRAWIGFSLSFCISDIMKGKVDTKDVLAIITSTHMQGPVREFAKTAWTCYNAVYWKEFDEAATMRMLRVLYPRIVQPRLTIRMHPHIGAMKYSEVQHWVSVPVMRD